MSKAEARLDEWLRELGPSTELRRWFGHDPDRWHAFHTRYRAELETPERRQRLDHVGGLAKEETVTLLYGAKDREHNQAVVIAESLKS